MHILLTSITITIEDVSKQYICKTMEENPVMFETIFAIITTIMGVLSIIVSVGNYIKNKQREAQFGFYINLLVYLRNLNYFLTQFPELIDLLIDEKAREDKDAIALVLPRLKSIKPSFVSLCDSFLKFISNAQNNIPPKNKPKDPEWGAWYKNMLDLSQFLQKCCLISDNLTLYFSKQEATKFKQETKALKTIIEDMENKISSVLKIKKDALIKSDSNDVTQNKNS